MPTTISTALVGTAPATPLIPSGTLAKKNEVGQQQPDRETGLGDAGVQAAFAPRGVFEDHQDRAAHSAPNARPCTTRTVTSRIGAQMPTAW